MKKIISLILAMLCVLSAGTAAFAEGTVIIEENQAETQPSEETKPEIPEIPVEEIPVETTAPEVPEQPEEAEKPAETAKPEASAKPETSAKPEASAKPEETKKPEAEKPAESPKPSAKPEDDKKEYVSQSRAVIGANLTDEQIAAVYQAFGVKRGDVIELSVTNAEEREYLEGYVPENLIGTRSISCVYVELLDEGSGMDVTTSNINWVTAEMYISALATAGITDAKIVVASPFEVSGTAALTGVYKAYEDMTGKKLDDLAKLVSTQELTITGSLAEEIGSMDSMSIVNDLKMMLDETAQMSDEEIKTQIVEIAGRYNVKLTDKQTGQLVSLCRSLEGLDADALKARVQEVQETLNKVSGAKTKVVGFVQTVKKAVESVKSFFQKIGDIIGLT